ERAVPILIGELSKEMSTHIAATDWTVRFHRWDDAGKDKSASQRLKVEAELAATDPLEGDKHVKAYPLEMTDGKSYVIDMMSREDRQKEVDGYLRLHDPGGKVVAQDDDSGGYPDARITFRCGETGTYKIVATTFQPSMTGKFLLTARDESTAYAAVAKLYQALKVEGELAATDAMDAGKHVKTYPLKMMEGKHYVIDMMTR